MCYVGGRKEDRVSTIPPITCEISEPGHGERGYCVPLTRNALALLVKEKASFGQEFGSILRSGIFYFFFGWGWDDEDLHKFKLVGRRKDLFLLVVHLFYAIRLTVTDNKIRQEKARFLFVWTSLLVINKQSNLCHKSHIQWTCFSW